MESGTVCPIVGPSKQLSEFVLPTSSDILQYCQLLKSQLSSLNKNKILDTVLEIIVAKLQKIWKAACIPIVSPQRIKHLLRILHDQRRAKLKSLRLKHTETYERNMHDFKTRINKLFDISLCKCSIEQKCYCKKGEKSTASAKIFLEDQRTSRALTLSSFPTTDSLSNNELSSTDRKLVRKTLASSSSNTSVSNNEIISDRKPKKRRVLKRKFVEVNRGNGPTPKKRKRYNTTKINTLALTLDRYNVHDRVGAAIASATLQDYGIIDCAANATDQVIDKNKVRRAKDKLRSTLNNDMDFCIKGLFFDGRKDYTLCMKDGKKTYIKESHYTLLGIPGYKYLGHVIPITGHAEVILKSLLDFFELKKIDLKDLIIIGCDGTVTNTGWIGGVIALLEKHLKRPLQWMICQLHENELPLRHLIEELIGETTGSGDLPGEIGKMLKNCKELPVVNFTPIHCELPLITKKDLSTDQRYLYDMCQAISNGYVSTSLEKRDPGKMVHSRWLTTGNRFLKTYVSTSKPSEELITLATFILKVYAPLWFTIKTKSSCIYGAKHVYKQIELIKYLPPNLKLIVEDVVQRNSYFAHPENVLLSMLGDERKRIRKLAVSRIMRHRRSVIKADEVRAFEIPKLKFDATDYTNMIDWKGISCEPPITARMTEDDLNAIANNPDSFRNVWKEVLCHTQPVEHGVKMVTEICSIVADVDKRDGAIRSKILSRSKMSKFDTKKDFNVTLYK